MALSNADRQRRWRDRQREEIEPLMRHRDRYREGRACGIIDPNVTPLELALWELGDALFELARETRGRHNGRRSSAPS
jgi:hypothetical protein